MGDSKVLRIYYSPPARAPRDYPPFARRNRPRSYSEWKALARWGQLPPWEPTPAGYLLRAAREKARLTQNALAERLACTQQAIAQAERWNSNPTVEFLDRWARACGENLKISFAGA